MKAWDVWSNELRASDCDTTIREKVKYKSIKAHSLRNVP